MGRNFSRLKCLISEAKLQEAPIIDALILCGGRAERMGGMDKGLIELHHKPLVTWVIERIKPQVRQILINANRNQEIYSQWGYPIFPDATPDYAGPLAGFQAGLSATRAEYLLVVPCDSPLVPINLVRELFRGFNSEQTQLTYVATPVISEDGETSFQTHPVFCLMKSNVLPSLNNFIHSGQRKIDKWFKELHSVQIVFNDDSAFANINSPDELKEITQKLC